jgi:nucleoside-diphosphate-sugar epimerase
VRAYRPHEIVHMGMIIDPAYLARNRTTGLEVNLMGAVNVLEAAYAFDVERIVAFSSIGVLPGVLYEPIDVAHPIVVGDRGPASDFYGAAKAAAEVLAFAYHQALGVDVRIIRPSAVYGLGMTIWVGPIKAFVEHAVRGEPHHVERGGPHPRDYTHARDIGGLVAAVLGAPEGADRVYYGATGRPLVTTSEVARIVNEVVPGAEVSIGDDVADDERAVMALRGQLSIDNARAQLGWEPAYGDVRDGIAQYAEQYRAFLAASG